MKVSVVITVLNEAESIEDLLKALANQTKKPDEVVIVDGGSSDSTVKKIQDFRSKEKGLNVKVFVRPGANIAEGRNDGIRIAKGEIIAVTDGGCIPHSDWVEKMAEPLKNKKIDVVAGFYRMIGRTSFQRALMPYLGILPRDFNPKEFLPSSRSIAFTKKIWEEAGMYPEKLERAGEDTLFNVRLIKTGAKIVRVKEAVVDWEVPVKNLPQAFRKFFEYAKGDAQARIWWHPTQKFSSHTLKILSVYFRYFLFLVFLFFSYQLFLVIILLYFGWIFLKHARKQNLFLAKARNTMNFIGSALWSFPIQIIADLGVMFGFLMGSFSRQKK